MPNLTSDSLASVLVLFAMKFGKVANPLSVSIIARVESLMSALNHI